MEIEITNTELYKTLRFEGDYRKLIPYESPYIVACIDCNRASNEQEYSNQENGMSGVCPNCKSDLKIFFMDTEDEEPEYEAVAGEEYLKPFLDADFYNDDINDDDDDDYNEILDKKFSDEDYEELLDIDFLNKGVDSNCEGDTKDYTCLKYCKDYNSCPREDSGDKP